MMAKRVGQKASEIDRGRPPAERPVDRSPAGEEGGRADSLMRTERPRSAGVSISVARRLWCSAHHGAPASRPVRAVPVPPAHGWIQLGSPSPKGDL